MRRMSALPNGRAGGEIPRPNVFPFYLEAEGFVGTWKTHRAYFGKARSLTRK